MTHIFIGIDPGESGGVAFLDEAGRVLKVVKMPATDVDIRDLLLWPAIEMPLIPRRAMIERVASSPVMGVKAAFTFGGSYRALKMALTCSYTPFDEVLPRRWQRAMECLSGGDKDTTKARAQQLFPGVKMTHAIADALLLAEYGRRQEVKTYAEATTTDNAADGVDSLQADRTDFDR